jgi:hypothetical protein
MNNSRAFDDIKLDEVLTYLLKSKHTIFKASSAVRIFSLLRQHRTAMKFNS